ncbi:MAG: arsenite efflux transporter metallochaperone ArsD [Blastocatellia bacterium]|nr:arsenite efflux transporter metallochaperone ArsD [Blastocatellia bacterium]
MKFEVFDPPMCCSTGVCGVDIDPVLPRFAADLEWLKTQGVNVERYNLAQQPGVFVANEAVNAVLHKEGNDCLPLILVDGRIVSRAAYPDRAALAGYAGINVAAAGRVLTVLPTASKCC